MDLGLIISLNENYEKEIEKVAALGFHYCQLSCWKHSFFNDETAEGLKAALKRNDVRISTLWCGWDGPAGIWNFYDGPLTLGLVPVESRYERMNQLMRGSDFAKKLGVVNVATHVGFLPEFPNTQEYRSLICTLRVVAEHCKANGQYFMFETGQETPVTLRRTIEDVGTGNLGVNLDPANLILYGKANPVDALDVLGPFVRDVHGKDGCYPTDGKNLGQEKPLGEGKVGFPRLIARLKEFGYDGTITIEREIDGEEQIRDIKKAKVYLESLI